MKYIEKAIQKAIDGGWKDGTHPEFKTWVGGGHWNGQHLLTIIQGSSFYHVNDLIYNHDFAKALWGELDIHDDETEFDYYYQSGNGANKVWEVHLQQMVIAEDPIKYLGENINAK